MAKMTWAELEDFIRNMDYNDVHKPVMIYDMETGEEIECDLVQFSSDSPNKEWDTYIGINLELETN
jgi:hypothetical protein